MANKPGQLVIISGPSGVGKSTVLRELLARFTKQLRLSVSATTRSPRKGEINGKDYHFLTNEQFASRRAEGEFLECAEVFGRGHWYGTLLSEVTPSLEQGKWVMLEIDVDGAKSALEHFPEAITIFILPNSTEELERRLRSRATETEEAITRRLEVAKREIERSGSYQYQVVNDQVDQAVNQISDLLKNQGIEK